LFCFGFLFCLFVFFIFNLQFRMVPLLRAGDPFPSLESARRRPNGLLAAGRDLSVPTLVEAYSRGIFPWFGEGEPILWWSPDPRMVLFPDELHVSKSLARRMKKDDHEVSLDRAFGAVIRGCAEPRADHEGTWITARMIAAYERLHAAGIAHSVETWMDGELAGGVYGVGIGRAFFGESMFTRRTDASKIALVRLVGQLAAWGFGVIDCQMKTAHLSSFGAREIPRRQFADLLGELVRQPGVAAPWRFTA
jgi:leucyl/phenylalanyl-tRNA--protein transferase